MDAFLDLEIRRSQKGLLDIGCHEANAYLAEDRVMCMQIFIKKKYDYFLSYVPDAIARTDAPDNIFTLIKQRRRWVNGSFFAAW